MAYESDREHWHVGQPPQPPAQPPAGKHRGPTFWVLIIGVPLFVAAVVGVLGVLFARDAIEAAKPKPLTVTGRITVTAGVGDGWFGSPGEPCELGGGYTDIHAGAQVVVSDAAGKTLALGSLGSGTQDGTGLHCVFSFSVPNVPPGEKFYGVEVSHRGRLQYATRSVSRLI